MIREDARYMAHQDWEPKVPDDDTMLKQAVIQLKRGKSTGNPYLDAKALNIIKKENKEDIER